MKWLAQMWKNIEYIFTGDTGVITRPMEIPPEIVMQPIMPPAPDPDKNRLALYNLAKSCLGRDIAATQNELGCAEAVSYLLHALKVQAFTPTLSTQQLYAELNTRAAFAEVKDPLPGDIIISPTGYSTKGSAHGHVGVVGFHGIMSNNSMSGLWDQYYTETSWEQYYKEKLGFPIVYFRLL